MMTQKGRGPVLDQSHGPATRSGHQLSAPATVTRDMSPGTPESEEEDTGARLQRIKARLANEKAIYEAMCETADLYQEMHSDDLASYPDDVRTFVGRQERGKKRARSSTPNTHETTPEPTQSEVPAQTPVPALRTAGRFKEPKTYKGKTLRELDEFLASIRGTF